MANSHLKPVLLSAYLDDEVTVDERILVESHLVTCETCQVELDGLRWTANLLHQLPEMPLPRNFYITEAMLEQPASSIKKSWLQWIQSLFDGIGAIPIGVGATVMALLLLMVIVQPFSTVSEPEFAIVSLATAELPNQDNEEVNEEISALAVLPEEQALMNESDDFAMDEAQMSRQESSGEAAAISEEQFDEVMSENGVFAEDESDASLDTIPSMDEEKNEPEAQETARPARPARSAPTATIEQPKQAEQAVTAPTLTLMGTPELSSAVDSTETTDSTENSTVSQSPSPIASAPKESEPEQAAPPSESDLVSTESNQFEQTMLIVIGMLLLLVFGTIYWRKRSN